MIEADLHERYGIDLDEPGLTRARRWRWLQVRIAALLAVDSRLATVLQPAPSEVKR